MHRLRRDQRDAGVERRLPQPLLHDGLGLRELRLGVDAAHFVLRHFERDRLQPHVARDLPPRRSDRIRPCGWRCRCGPGFPAPYLPSNAISPPLQSAIARSLLAGVGVLDDGEQFVALRHQPAVAGRVGGLEARAPRPPRRRPAPRAAWPSVCGRISGVSPKITRTSSAPCSIAARAASTACAVPRRSRLHEHLRPRRDSSRLSGRTSSCSGPTTTAIAVLPAASHALQHMTEQRAARHRVQHLRPRRPHPRAFAGRQHDRQARSPAHSDSIARRCAVIAGCAGRGTFGANLLMFSTR